MHVHKNYTDAFKKKLRPPLEYGRDFFLVSCVFLAKFLHDSCEIPESQWGTNPCSRFSTCARLMTYELALKQKSQF